MKVKTHLLENWLLLPLCLSILGIDISYARTTAKLSNATPKPGDDVVLMCITSPAGDRYALFSHTKKFKEDSPQQKWITLARMLDPVTTVPIVAEGRYSVSSKFAGTPVVEHYNLTIKNVKFADSGFLGCAYKDKQKNIDESDFDKLLVLVDGKSVEFSEYQNNTDLDYEDFIKDPKNLKLTCIAKGTIPGEQRLYLGRTNITADGIATVVETGLKQVGDSGGAESSWTSTLVYDKPFTPYMIGKSISCQYETRGFAMKTSVVHLQSAVSRPHLKCSETVIDEIEYGHPASFVCTVNMKPELTNVIYKLEGPAFGSKEYIKKGKSYKNEIYSVYEPNADGTEATLTLLFKEVRYVHKNMKIILFVGNAGGHSTQDFLIRRVIDQPATERLSETKDIAAIVGYVIAAILGLASIILTVLLFIYRDKAKTYCEKKCACCPKHKDEESVPLTAEVTPAISSITITEAMVTWDAPTQRVNSYAVLISPTTDGALADPISIGKGDPLKSTLRNLTAGTEYTVTVTAVTKEQKQGVQSDKTFTTKPNRVDGTKITCVGITTERVCVKWSAPGGRVTSYDISINPESDGAQIHSQSVLADDELKADLESLLAGTKYTVSITSIADGQKSKFPATTTFTTAPNPVDGTTIYINSITTTSAEVRWNAPDGGLTSYEIDVNPKPGDHVTYPLTVLKEATRILDLQYLIAGSEYTVSITTEANEQKSRVPTTKKFTTDEYVIEVTYETQPKVGPTSLKWDPSEDFKEEVRRKFNIDGDFYIISIEERDNDILASVDVHGLINRARRDGKKPSVHAFPGEPWVLTVAGKSYPLTERPRTDTDLVCCMKKEYLDVINLDKVETFLMQLVPYLKKAYYNLIISGEKSIAADLYKASANELNDAIQGSTTTVKKFEDITSSNLTFVTRIFTALSRNSEHFAAKKFLDAIRENTKTKIDELTKQKELLDKARDMLVVVQKRTVEVAGQVAHTGDNSLKEAKEYLDESIQYISFVSAIIGKIKIYWTDVEDMVNRILQHPCIISLDAALSDGNSVPGTLGEMERRVEQRTEVFMKDGIGLMARLVAMQDIFNEAFGYLQKSSSELVDFIETHVERPDVTTAKGRLSSPITKPPISKEFKEPTLDPDEEVLIHTYYKLKYKILNAAKPGTGDQAESEPEEVVNSPADILSDVFALLKGRSSGAQASN